MKTKFILGFLFILIILVGLPNIYVLNYSGNNNNNKICMSNTRKYFQAHFQGRYLTPENKIVFQKMFFKK